MARGCGKGWARGCSVGTTSSRHDQPSTLTYRNDRKCNLLQAHFLQWLDGKTSLSNTGSSAKYGTAPDHVALYVGLLAIPGIYGHLLGNASDDKKLRPIFRRWSRKYQLSPTSNSKIVSSADPTSLICLVPPELWYFFSTSWVVATCLGASTNFLQFDQIWTLKRVVSITYGQIMFQRWNGSPASR